ncbi:hypothetical protein HW932_19790 [Allochromatium humboldtianum]|uniref:Uncharacterized protein n=1 Tax=Allochromatium humboldtianum TaxID=504901 RepID=A0A850RH36_9GAMM|nr:hypothetical protein [Allochromatium humboldtianum]NVZ11496.1 hypothetical protein [Allochromatium humboldtianum]
MYQRRRHPWVFLSIFMLMLGSVPSAWAQSGGSPQVSQEIYKHALTSLPVLPSGISLGTSTTRSVRPDLQRLTDGGAILNEGVSAYTSGALLNVGQTYGDGLAGELGLRLMSLNFERDQTLALVFFMVQRGWQDQNVEPLIDRLVERYALYTSPIFVQDGRGDNADRYVLFNLERFIVEIAIPENGSFAQVTLATRERYETIKKQEGTADLLFPWLGIELNR